MKLKKKIFKRAISLMLIVTLVTTPVIRVKAEERSDNTFQSSEVASSSESIDTVTGGSISVTSNKFSGDGFEVEYCVTGQWDGAYNSNITITNTGNTVIENWMLRFDMQNEITNIWNASIESFDDGVYLIKNAK